MFLVRNAETRSDGDIYAVQHAMYPKTDAFDYAFFGRHGGYSAGVLSTLNASLRAGDDAGSVSKNYQAIADYMGITVNSMFVAKQECDGNAVIVDSMSDRNTKADALITKERGLMLCVTSADCVPLVFVDAKEQVIAIAHAGWKEQKIGVVALTVDAMNKLGANDITMIIGPCIRRSSYGVQQDFFDEWIGHDPESEDFFADMGGGRYTFNLAGNVSNLALREGVTKIHDCCIDTYSDDNFFSCRRAKHGGSQTYGVNISSAVLR